MSIERLAATAPSLGATQAGPASLGEEPRVGASVDELSERSHAVAGRSLAWFAANGLVFLACLIGLARVDGAAHAGNAGAASRSALGAERVQRDVWETRNSIYGGTPARVRFQLPDAQGPRAQALSAEVWRETERIGRIFSAFDANTEVGRLNATTGPASVALSPDLNRVLVVSRQVWQASGGAFDPTIWPIRTLWHDAVAAQRPPTDAEIASALRRVGLGRMELSAASDGTARTSLPAGGVQLDFGGIAKGYAVDRVEAVLRAAGVKSALIALGGEICAFGDDDGKPWTIGVQHPRDDQALWGVISVRGGLRVSTSGNYRQPLQIAGKTYYHIMDPRTGRPISTAAAGVTTLDVQGRASSALLDAAATAIAVLGPEAGLALARRLGIEALILVTDDDNQLRQVMTDGFGAYFKRQGA